MQTVACIGEGQVRWNDAPRQKKDALGWEPCSTRTQGVRKWQGKTALAGNCPAAAPAAHHNDWHSHNTINMIPRSHGASSDGKRTHRTYTIVLAERGDGTLSYTSTSPEQPVTIAWRNARNFPAVVNERLRDDCRHPAKPYAPLDEERVEIADTDRVPRALAPIAPIRTVH